MTRLGSYLGIAQGSGQSDSLATAIVRFVPPLVVAFLATAVLEIRLETFTGFLIALGLVLACAIVWGLALRWADRRRQEGP